MINAIFENWKTSVSGVVVLALTAAFLLGRFDASQFVSLVGLASGAGLMLARDAK
jgi:hypothetical protein